MNTTTDDDAIHEAGTGYHGPTPEAEAAHRLCGCTADTELAAGSTCTACGHRDHGRSGCRAEAAHRDSRIDEARPLDLPVASRDGEVAAALDVERLARAMDGVLGYHGDLRAQQAEAIAFRYARLAAPSAPSSGDLDAADWESIRLVLGHFPTWFPELEAKVAARLASQPRTESSEPDRRT